MPTWGTSVERRVDDGKLATGAWGVIVLDGEAITVEAWNIKP